PGAQSRVIVGRIVALHIAPKTAPGGVQRSETPRTNRSTASNRAPDGAPRCVGGGGGGDRGLDGIAIEHQRQSAHNSTVVSTPFVTPAVGRPRSTSALESVGPPLGSAAGRSKSGSRLRISMS